jgi:2-iminobutanoate/2-iminopropanoate deaminase
MSDRPGITTVLTDKAPAPAGHYVQATVCNGMVYVSGQLAVRPDGTHAPELSFEDQVRQAMDNLLAVVHAAGSSPARLLKVTAYIVGIENWPRFNSVVAEVLGDIKAARTVVPVPELHYSYQVEIDAIAAIDPTGGNDR